MAHAQSARMLVDHEGPPRGRSLLWRIMLKHRFRYMPEAPVVSGVAAAGWPLLVSCSHGCCVAGSWHSAACSACLVVALLRRAVLQHGLSLVACMHKKHARMQTAAAAGDAGLIAV